MNDQFSLFLVKHILMSALQLESNSLEKKTKICWPWFWDESVAGSCRFVSQEPRKYVRMYEQEPPAQNYIAVAWKSGRQIWVCGAQLTGNHLYMEVPAAAGLYLEPEVDLKDQKL